MGKRTDNGPPGGRPTDYREEYVEQAFNYALLGATNDQMAEFFGVAKSTFALWFKKSTEFSEAIKKGRHDADAQVVKSLYKRATGYTCREVTYEKIGSKEEAMEISREGEIEEVTEDMYKLKVTVKEIAPDPVSTFFWLKNRRPEIWRDKKEIDANLKGDVVFKLINNADNDPLPDSGD